MFHYEYEKRPPSASSCSTRTTTTDLGRSCPSASRVYPNAERARRPLPPTPIIHPVTLPTKPTVPLRVWVIAGASCLAVCAALVLATIVVARWGTATTYTTSELYHQSPDPIYESLYPSLIRTQPTTFEPTTTDKPTKKPSPEDDLDLPTLEKISMFKNLVTNREKNKRIENPDLTLISKPQLHPLHDETIHHEERRIEKKDKAKYSSHLDLNEPNDIDLSTSIEFNERKDINYDNEDNRKIGFHNDFKPQNNVPLGIKTVFLNGKKQDGLPEFKPALPDVLNMAESYIARGYEDDYSEYYNDENLYDDYMQSNTMTSYLIEKIQELHDWITSDPDFQVNNATSKAKNSSTGFTQLLKALNETIIEGNVTIIMNKLKDIYFGDNYTTTNHSRKVILSNSTDLLSFGILTLDVILLHNIQVMAWENQEGLRNKMLRNPDVFAFNALFLDPSTIRATHDEVYKHENSISSLWVNFTQRAYSDLRVQYNNVYRVVMRLPHKRQNGRHEPEDYYDVGRNILENIMEVGMSTARAAIHLGRAYKNTKAILSQLSNPNREVINAQIQQQISRNAEGNQQALAALRGSYAVGAALELDCAWLLYCRNLVATSTLHPPVGPMANLNGIALRMLTGELPADKAIDTLLYEALTGWSELKCNDMFPRCSKVNAAAVIMDSILAPIRKSQSSSRS